MPYVKPELIEKAKEIDPLTYLETYEPDNFVNISVNMSTTKSNEIKGSQAYLYYYSK